MKPDMWLYGGILTFVVATISLVAVLVAVKLYRPGVRMHRLVGGSLMTMGLCGMAALQVLGSYSEDRLSGLEVAPYYKAAERLQQEDSVYPVLAIKDQWEQEGTVDMKFLLASAYLKNGQTGKADRLLEEVKLQQEDLRFVPKQVILDMLTEVEALGEETAAASTKASDAVRLHMEPVKAGIRQEAGAGTEDLELLASLDVEYLHYQVKSGTYSSSPAARTAEQSYKEALAREQQSPKQQSPEVKRAMAQYAVFSGKYAEAERLLADQIRTNPHDAASIALLSELYLSGQLQPGEAAMQLPQFKRAEQRTNRELIAAFQKQQEQELPEDTNGPVFEYDKTLGNELVYAMIEPSLDGGHHVLLDARMSRYYFNRGDAETSLAYINDMKAKKEQMTPYQKFVIHEVEKQESGPEAIMDPTAREQQYYWRQEAFQVLHSPKLVSKPTIEDQSYAYHLSDKLRNPNVKRIAITGVQTSDDGEITLYVQTDNLPELTKKSLSLLDNNNKIDSFELVKLGETTNFQRSLGVIIDVSGSMEGDRIEAARQATAGFVGNLKGYEQAEIIAFSNSPSLVQTMTGNTDSLAQAALALRTGGGTNITDAFLYGIERLDQVKGQRILFMFTDGEDSRFSQPESRANIILLANRAGIPIYAVGFGAGYETLSEVAEGTGGMFIASPNVSSILNGFDDVAKTLENTYKLTYTIGVSEAGKHIADLTLLQEGLSSSKEYTFGAGAWSDDTEPVKLIPDDGSQFKVDYASPASIYKAKDGKSEITLKGLGLKETASARIGQLSLKHRVKDGSTLEVEVPNTLAEGEYDITLTAQDGRKAAARISVIQAGLMQSVKFGWSTVYGRTITPDGKSYKIAGDPSVDKFIYPSAHANEMVLKDGKELTFQGMTFAVDKTKVNLAGQLATGAQQAVGSFIAPTVSMTLKDYGEHFTLSYLGVRYLTFNRVGVEFQLADITYQAKKDGAGKVEAKAGFAGKGDAQQSLRLPSAIKMFPVNELTLTASIEPDNIGIQGTTELEAIGKQNFLIVRNAKLGVENEFARNRLMLNGGFSTVEYMGRPISLGIGAVELSGIELTLGWENSSFAAFGLTVEGEFPLGTTGFTLAKLGFLADFSSAAEGKLEAGFSTIADKVKPYVLKLNSIKIGKKRLFNISPQDARLLSLEGEAGVKGLGASDWEFNGSAQAKMFGFQLAEAKMRVNNQLFKLGIEADALVGHLSGDVLVIYSDPRRNDSMTIGLEGEVTALSVGLKAKLLAVPARIDTSAYLIAGTAFGEDFELFSGGEIEVFQ